ncbi:MAG TPA: histidinol-phosphate transaminase [Actinophytocola sp.]|uniref:histidinol-phosphate transaminase n=1 Tax=Actinophytocola sp. TaxID=1872138 RepID=UPI002DBEDA23|nr:histidinol-phosphate transaminase [Actinophytocola sp.]HEU5470054.1 histidinol-phosphate transaminase [Actinophytocola sp.]
MPITVRADLAAIPDYVPGRKIPGAVVLSSNEVATPPPDSVLAAITEAAAEVNRYPQWSSDDLLDRLSGRLGMDAGRISIGAGSVSLCQQIIQAMCEQGDEVVFPWRSFEAYPILTQVAGATERRVPLTADHRQDLDGLLAAITDRTRVVFTCVPNNPTGTVLHAAELDRFLAAVPDHVLVVLDEAYREFNTDPDVPDGLRLAADRENLALLRTFSKAYGLAGARAGYAVAPAQVAAGMRKVAIPFSVSRLAQAAALATLDAADELLARCQVVIAERDRVRGELLAMGYEVPESQGNFVWLPLAERTVAFNEHCVDQKVLVRAFAGDGARVTIGLREENDAFLAAARTFPGRAQ